MDAVTTVPAPVNEPVRQYPPGSQDRAALESKIREFTGSRAELTMTIGDKPTGAMVGQQPFGGARASGTNDKAGSIFNLVRWVDARAIKELLVPPTDYRYPHVG